MRLLGLVRIGLRVRLASNVENPYSFQSITPSGPKNFSRLQMSVAQDIKTYCEQADSRPGTVKARLAEWKETDLCSTSYS
jgi:hypothetical protein